MVGKSVSYCYNVTEKGDRFCLDICSDFYT